MPSTEVAAFPGCSLRIDSRNDGRVTGFTVDNQSGRTAYGLVVLTDGTRLERTYGQGVFSTNIPGSANVTVTWARDLDSEDPALVPTWQGIQSYQLSPL